MITTRRIQDFSKARHHIVGTSCMPWTICTHHDGVISFASNSSTPSHAPRSTSGTNTNRDDVCCVAAPRTFTRLPSTGKCSTLSCFFALSAFQSLSLHLFLSESIFLFPSFSFLLSLSPSLPLFFSLCFTGCFSPTPPSLLPLPLVFSLCPPPSSLCVSDSGGASLPVFV